MADQWYVGRSGQRAGPYTTEQVRQMAAAGQLLPSDLLWKDGLENWVPLTQVKGLLPTGVGGTLPPLELRPQAGFSAGPDFHDAPAAGSSAAAEWNPYQSGTGPLGQPPAADGTIVYADFLPRVGASVLDAVFIGILGMILQFGLGMVFGVMSGGDDEMIGVGSMLGSLASLVLTLVYFVGYETSDKQGTWGKQLLGIRVTDLQGRRISTGRAVGRYFAKIISNFTCGIGYLLPLFTDRKQTLHDLISGCLALKK